MFVKLLDEHPMICSMLVSTAIVTITLTLALLFYTTVFSLYEYTDLDGNVGYAENCFCKKGSRVCYLKDGGVVSVKRYKRLN